MSEYRAIYKCRLCGESFVDYVHAKDEDAAAKKVIDFSLVYSGAHVSRLKVPRNFQSHSCNDGTTHTYMAPYVPAQYIENIDEFDVEALNAALKGE